jgi:hypothetical protein
MFAKSPTFFSKRAMRIETHISMLWGRPYEAAGVVRNCTDTRTEQHPYHTTK